MDNTERSYIAFISYRHQALDREAAERVQKKIENYVIPKEFRKQAGGKKLGVCFRDEDELPASSSLTDSIYYALDHTKYLIVICTPDLPLSKWCEAEIRYFLKTHDRDHILAVLADGDPEESFSPYMLHDFDEEGNVLRDWEPLAANIAGENHSINNKSFKKEVVRLYAAMIGCPFDALWQRERRARTNRLLTAAGAAVAVMAVFLGVVLNRNAQIAAQNEQIKAANDQITAQNDELTEKNDKITEQNDQIEKQNTQLQSQLSTVLVDSGISKLENYDRNGALEDALAALESSDPDVYDHRAEKLLADALGAYKCGQLQSSLVYEQTTNITQIKTTDDSRRAVLLDHVGAVRCLDLSDFSVAWDYLVKDTDTQIYTEGLGDQILLKSADRLLCLSASDGSVLWSYTQDSPSYFQCISDDSSVFALMDTKTGEDGLALPSDTQQFPDTGYFRPVYAVFLDTKTGREIARTELAGDDTYGFFRLTNDYKDRYFVSDFSEDNSKFACVLPFRTKHEETSEVQETLFVIDVEKQAFFCPSVPVSETVNERVPYDVFFGMEIDNSAGHIFLLQNDAKEETIDIHNLRFEKDRYQQTDTTQDFYFSSDTITLDDAREVINSTVPMLSSGSHMVFFTDKVILIASKTTYDFSRTYHTDSRIIQAEWIDKDEEIFQIVTASGSVLRLDLSTDDYYRIDSREQFYLEENDLSCLTSLNGGIIANKSEGSCLIVENRASNRLLQLHYQTDPNVRIIRQETDDLVIDHDESMIGLLPDSDTGMVFLNGKTVLTFDRKTGEVLHASEMREEFSHGILNNYLLDETHFVQSNRIYSTEDGSVSVYPDDNPNLKDGFYDADLYLNQRLQNGDLLTTGMRYAVIPDENGESYRILLFYDYWINRVYQSIFFITDATEGDLQVPQIGENGIIFYYGDYFDDEEKPVFHLWDSKNEWVYEYGKPFPDEIGYLSAVATDLPLAAVLYENGKMQFLVSHDGSTNSSELYNLDTGQFSAMNEALSMCFSEGDQYLLVLSSAGQLIITDIGDFSSNLGKKDDYEWSYPFHGTIDLFRDNIRDYDNFIRADLSEDEKTMFLYAGYEAHCCNAVFMETGSWTIKAEIPDIYSIDEANNRIYAFTDNADGNGASAIVSYPVYTLEDLKAWALEVLEHD